MSETVKNSPERRLFAGGGLRGFLHDADGWIRTWGPLLLLVFAVCYYGQYYRSGLNLGGEGGTVAVNAMRLNEGWLPIKQTTLNYNVMWFYPVAWLFKITGPDYIALRIYFFGLCLISGLLGFFIVRRVTGRGWAALATALVILAIPGMLFRNYLGLLPLLNVWGLLHAFVWTTRSGWRRWAWFAGAGLALGLTFLVRIDVGAFFLMIYLGLVALYPLGVRGKFLARAAVAVGGGLTGILAALALHVPVYLDARHRGFAREFTEQYSVMWNQIRYEATRRLPRSPPTSAAQPSNHSRSGWTQVRFHKTPKNWAAQTRAERASREQMERSGRPREDLRDIFRQPSLYDAAFIIALYLPIVIGGIIVAGAGAALFWAIFRPNPALKESALVCLVTLGAALTLFPQYFFFRPDTPHLSEFMIPFLVAMMAASFYATRLVAAVQAWPVRVAGVSFVLLCALGEGVFFFHSFPKESAGTIAAARKRTYEVVADNGVRVFVKKAEQNRIQGLHDTIVRFTGPGDSLITYPYSPTINFMTNRDSYLKNLYVDNATAPRDFLQQTVAEIKRLRPAAIVIDQRDINDTEISRFRNWAAPVYDYIRRHYVLVGTFGENEVYVHPQRISPQT